MNDAGESKEDYLERILMLSKEKENVHAVDIAASMGFSKPSVSVAMKKLQDLGYVEVGPHQELLLTETGKQIAEKIYERHEILGGLFMALGIDEEIAYEDACKVEHDLSNETFDAIKKYYLEHKKN